MRDFVSKVYNYKWEQSEQKLQIAYIFLKTPPKNSTYIILYIETKGIPEVYSLRLQT